MIVCINRNIDKRLKLSSLVQCLSYEMNSLWRRKDKKSELHAGEEKEWKGEEKEEK